MWRICGVSKAEPVLFGVNVDDDYVSVHNRESDASNVAYTFI